VVLLLCCSRVHALSGARRDHPRRVRVVSSAARIRESASAASATRCLLRAALTCENRLLIAERARTLRTLADATHFV